MVMMFSINFMLIISSLLLCLFMYFSNPMGMGMLLFLLSVVMVMMLNFFTSSWFAYILFLVYIGGLLVMFIYICMISSNYQMKNWLNMWNMSVMIMISGFFVNVYLINQKSIVFYSININGLYLPFLLFMMLVIYLLICFFVIINIILSGDMSLKIASTS